MEAEETGINVKPVNAHRVIVIPEQRRILLIGVIVGTRLTRYIPLFREAVPFRRCFATVQMNNVADFRLVAFRATERVVDRQEMLCRQIIYPLHEHSLSAFCVKHYTRNCASE